MARSTLHERILVVAGRLTYGALADKTSFHPETVRRYMQGGTPSTEFLMALCFAFDVNAHWLLLGEGPIRYSEVGPHSLGDTSPIHFIQTMRAALQRLGDRVDALERGVRRLESRVRRERIGAGARAPRTKRRSARS